MAVSKNSKEKNELYKTLWAIANDVRGTGVTGWDFKAYIMNTLFYRYISEKLCKFINDNERKTGNKDFDYALLSDADVDAEKGFREEVIKDIGYFLYPSELFCNVVKDATTNPDLNIKLDSVFKNIENSAKNTDSEECFAGLFNDFDLNSESLLGKTLAERNKKLALLLTRIASVDFGGDYLDNDSDVFGDAYEYLMGMYASDAGKKGGEFYTPQCVSKLLMKIATYGKTKVDRVYDPTCGSGSLLLQAAKILGRDNVEVGYFGQEVSPTTQKLCRMNMVLHNIAYSKFDIVCDNTLLHPAHINSGKAEVVVANYPYSVKWVGKDDITLINDPRFAPAGVLAPKSKADFAFIMHCNYSLAEDGVSAIVCFPGIMYRDNKDEKKIRKHLVDTNQIDCIIQLPPDLFYGTPIATCIMVMKKNKADNSILFIDASNEFKKEVNQNILDDNNIDNILKLYVDRMDIEYKSKLVDYDDIVKNKYNLSVSTYVEKEDTREVIDINDLNTRLENVVLRENQLRTDIQQIIKEI